MPRFDFDLAQLRTYRPTPNEPTDFDAFWTTTLAEARAASTVTVVTPYESLLTGFDVFDVEFSGFGGHPIKAWFIVPADADGPLPTVVEYNGYGGGRGPAAPGFMTRGIEDPSTYYYRRVLTDAVRAVDVVREFPQVDQNRVAVCGGSQGGGIALAVAGLHPHVVATMPEVPFLCHFERAVGLTDSDPYQEVVRYLAVHRDLTDQTFRTLAYFDGLSFAARATAPAIFSVGLLDPVCPPSTVFAAHNNYAGDSIIEVYAFNEHEGGQGQHWRKQARWLSDRVG